MRVYSKNTSCVKGRSYCTVRAAVLPQSHSTERTYSASLQGEEGGKGLRYCHLSVWCATD